METSETKRPNSDYGLVVASPLEYERLVCEIYRGKSLVALISQERGEGLFDLETAPPADFSEAEMVRKIDLNEFLEQVARACRHLKGE